MGNLLLDVYLCRWMGSRYLAFMGESMTVQGTASLLSLAASLRESREKVANFYGRQDAMRDMAEAADALERLAHLEPDLEVQHGEN